MKRILISRTDSIGDVMLTLPISGFLKKHFPESEILFLGKNYTRPVIECAKYIDTFISWDELCMESPDNQIERIKALQIDVVIHVFPNKAFAKIAKKANIPVRIGTSHRFFHWLTCNKLVHFTRKNSSLHESQLNFQLLKPLFPNTTVEVPEMLELSGFLAPQIPVDIDGFIRREKKNIILHTKSKGSAREWGLANFAELIRLLPPEKYNIILTGTEEEGQLYRADLVNPFPHVMDVSGKFSLTQLIALISKSDALVACSTGPLHIASALNIHAIGIYPPIKPMFPKRWGPIGSNSKVFVKEKDCNKCRNNNSCSCMTDITPYEVAQYIKSVYS